MNTVTIKSYITRGLETVPVNINTKIIEGIGIHLVGLQDIAVKEVLLRSVTALQAAGFTLPGKKIVIYVKTASGESVTHDAANLDLPVAVSILAAAGSLIISQEELDKYAIVGELGLDGSVRNVRGAYGMALSPSRVILPKGNAALLKGLPGVDFMHKVYVAEKLADIKDILLNPVRFDMDEIEFTPNMTDDDDDVVEAGLIRGADSALRAMEIAAAGGHSMRINGKAGSGRGYIAKCLRSVLPKLSTGEYIECEHIRDILGQHMVNNGVPPMCRVQPFMGLASVVGGGSGVLPGEVSLAHNGMLVLENIDDCNKHLLSAVGVAAKDGKVTITRLHERVEYPSRFLLVGLSEKEDDSDSADGLFDMYCDVRNLKIVTDITDTERTSSAIARRVAEARQRQAARYAGTQYRLNADLGGAALFERLRLSDAAADILTTVAARGLYDAFFLDNVKRIARTVADLEGSDTVETNHVTEAMSFVSLNKKP